MDRTAAPARVFRFGLFEVDVQRRTLARKGARIKIQDQPLRTLILLLERSGEIVTREELRQELWAEDTHVDFDGSLNVILRKLRAAIDDDPDNPRFVETVPRRGYRFIAPVSSAPSLVDPVSVVSVSLVPESIDEPTLIAGGAKPEMDAGGPSVAGGGTPSISRNSISVKRMSWWVLAFVALMAFLPVAWRYSRRNASVPAPAPARKVIAVLPFSNEGAGPDFDYLRYAIANDLVTDLSYTHSVSVRPFASTSRYSSEPIDPAAVGGELKATHVVAGGFLLDKKSLRVNIELVDVARNQSVWQGEVTVSPEELIALHDKLAARAVQELLPAMNVSGGSPSHVPTPKNERALDLFLHSLTIPLDPKPNKIAIQKLEESVSLDKEYSPAWEELGWRYYIDYHYGGADEGTLTKALDAYKHAQLADPNSAINTVTIRAEQGDLYGAYDQAVNLLRKWPRVGSLHYEMSYVLRYAGLLDEAGKECDAALAFDPGYSVYRSCAVPFILAGNYAHAFTFIRLDENSGFGAMSRMLIALRSGDTTRALAESNAASQSGFGSANLARLYLSRVPAAELNKASAELETDPKFSRDPENLYVNAAVLSFCGQGDAALRQLRQAIKANYCSYPAMDSDPLFDSIRQRPQFAELRQAAAGCQQNFLSHREQVETALARPH
jgi:DNA-binding winged helix-turn-helix (wHTH) protein/TolB-like protein